MERDLFVHLLTKWFTSELSSAEKDEFAKLMQKYPEWGYEYYVLTEYWKEEETDMDDVDAAWDRHQVRYIEAFQKNEVEMRGEKRNRARPVLYMSITVFLLVLTFLLYRKSTIPVRDNMVENEVTTYNNMHKKVQLPDGTMAVLNSNSVLTYDSSLFAKGLRSVSLVGGGFFEVRKDPKHPFVLHMNRMTITVLGTAFEVSDYPGQPTTHATLLHGKIQLDLPDQVSKKIILLPNEKLTVKYEVNGSASAPKYIKPTYILTGINAKEINGKAIIKDTSWMQDQMALDNDSLSDIVQKLEVRYGVIIQIMDADIAGYTYSGVLGTTSLEKILAALSSIQLFHYKIQNGKVMITK